MHNKIAVIGESMIEIKPGNENRGRTFGAAVGYGGDTLNCSVYMSRLGTQVDYVTALGDDPLSDWLLEQWREEGIGCELVHREPGAVPGLYLIETDDTGERSFFYWRAQSPAREVFDVQERRDALFAKLREYPFVYLSGITLAIYSVDVRKRLFDFLADYRTAGGRVVFDNNYRPKQWPDVATAQAAYESIYRCCDIALPTFDDEQDLFGDESPADALARMQNYGVKEIALKLGPGGCLIANDVAQEQITGNAIDNVVDTTAAGDSFNAGYMAARLAGTGTHGAARQGNRLAGTVIQHPGAIIPRQAMPG
ncbi:MAG: sugar kinase [Gammaproteobacteria bacterium]